MIVNIAGLSESIQVGSYEEKVMGVVSSSQHTVTVKQFGGSKHVRCVKGGFEMEFQKGRLQTLFVYYRTRKIESFQGLLPYGVHSGWKVKGAVMLLGEPGNKAKGSVQLIYPHLGMGLVFQGDSWLREEALIDYAYFYPPEDRVQCAGCGKIAQSGKAQKGCSCGLVFYCKKECRSRHIGLHMILCDRQSLVD